MDDGVAEGGAAVEVRGLHGESLDEIRGWTVGGDRVYSDGRTGDEGRKGWDDEESWCCVFIVANCLYTQLLVLSYRSVDLSACAMMEWSSSSIAGSMPKSSLRNLLPDEIVGQLLSLKQGLGDFGHTKGYVHKMWRDERHWLSACLLYRDSPGLRVRSVVMVSFSISASGVRLVELTFE